MSRLLLEYTLQEVAPGDALVKQIAYEFADLFEQCQKEGIILTEGEIGNTQLKSIFKDAAKVTQGKKIEKSEFRKAFDQGVKDGEAAAGATGKAIKGGVLATAQGAAKLNKGFDNLVKKYEGKEGVTEFNAKADKAIAKVGEKVRKVKGGDSAIKVLKKLGDWGKENPGKQAIALGALAALGGFMSGGAIPAVAVPIYKAITAGASGDKLTTILAKAAKGAAIGAVGASVGDAIGDALDDDIKSSSAGGVTKVQISTDPEDELSQVLADMTEEEVKLEYARQMLIRQLERANMEPVIDEDMVQKIANAVKVSGYPDDIKVSFGGNWLRGSLYATPEEMAAFHQHVGGGQLGALSKEGTEWIKNNVEGGQEHIERQVAEWNAWEDEQKMKYDAMSPDEKQAYDKQNKKLQDW